MPPQDNLDRTGAVIVYDGECPFCSRFARMIRLRAAVGPVTLVDARQSAHPVVARCHAAGVDLDTGMAVELGGRIYHGDDAMVLLASLTTPVGLMNRLSGWVFRSPTRARLLYPLLVAGRNLSLRLMGRRRIGRV